MTIFDVMIVSLYTEINALLDTFGFADVNFSGDSEE
jgi:hypothetical protein